MPFKFLTKVFSTGKKDDNPSYTMGMHEKKKATFGSNVQSSRPSQLTGFGQARAQQLEHRLNSAIKDRQRLARAQGASGSDLQAYWDRKAQMAENRIKRMQDSVADDKSR